MNKMHVMVAISSLVFSSTVVHANPDSEHIRIVTGQCAEQSLMGRVDFGSCLSQNLSNHEAQIAYACAQTSWQGGPWAVAGCTASQLTRMEFDKCRNGIGTENGCFGPNNTIRKHVENAVNDINHGPGPTNDVFGDEGWMQNNLGFHLQSPF